MAWCQADIPHLPTSRSHQHTNIDNSIVTVGSGTTMNTIVEARDVAPKITKVEEEVAATEKIAAMATKPKRHTPTP